jgi:hypothetical protein
MINTLQATSERMFMNSKLKLGLKVVGVLALAFLTLVVSLHLSHRPKWEHVGSNTYVDVNSSWKDRGLAFITVRSGDSYGHDMSFDCNRSVYFENRDANEVKKGSIAERIMRDACEPRWYDVIQNLFE